MKYTVEWKPDAEQDLARVWMNAPDRDAITAAVNALDGLLERDPYSQSESRWGPVRILFQRPLGVLFTVDETRRLVRITAVWRWTPRA